MRQSEENVQMIMLMCELDPSYLMVEEGDGIAALIKAMIDKHK